MSRFTNPVPISEKETASLLIKQAFEKPNEYAVKYKVIHNDNIFINIGKRKPFPIHAQEWISAPLQDNNSKIDHERVLCVHGWLDNSQSFSKLAPLLAERYPLHIIAYDDAGCGHSAWKEFSNYPPLETSVDILKIVSALGWNNENGKLPHFIGHSRGAVCSMFFAASFPEYIDRLILIDAIGIHTRQEMNSALTLRKAALKSDQFDNYSLRIFKDEEEAALKLMNDYGYGMTLDSARRLVSGQLIKCEGGYSFSYDRNMIKPSTSVYYEAQVLSFVASITCPVMLLTPKSHSILEGLEDKAYQRFKILNQRKNVESRFRVCNGNGHHFHLNEPESCVGHILDFISLKDSPSNLPSKL